MDQVPEKALLWLDDDVAEWLHDEAEANFGGDVNKALNECLRVLIAADREPDDPWAGIEHRLKSRRR